MATNRADTLDPALLRPGRLDRKIEFPLPDRRQKRLIFQVGRAVWIDLALCMHSRAGIVERERTGCISIIVQNFRLFV